MNSLYDCFKLNNGVDIPCLGLGTWKSEHGKEAEKAVAAALENGYRHIDTATAYENESSVGEAIRKSGISRENIFVTSKLPNWGHSYNTTIELFNTTLNNLGLDYLDLYLIHWPNPQVVRDHWQKANAETWKAMEEFVERGKIRAIGISNFLPHHIDALMENARITPAVNQIRLCPGGRQDKVVEYCRKCGIIVEAYSPLGSDGEGSVLGNSTLLDMAGKYGKSTAQICIRWCLQNDYLPLPKSVNPSRIKENADVFDFVISAEDMDVLNRMTEYEKYIWDPDTVLW
jgi:diketogulonate reductase-like aldo/keto reductase